MRKEVGMNRSRLGLKALGLCVLAVGVMAIGFAGVAQAEETGGTWTWSNAGKTGTFGSTLEASPIIALENNTASLLFTTGGGTKVTFLCTGAAFDEGGQLAGGGEILFRTNQVLGLCDAAQRNTVCSM
jgi:hypothetical protein